MNIFERAARCKLRFTVTTGIIAVEDLFDLPLTVTGNRLSLEKVARQVYSELKQFDDVSFVDIKPSPRKIELELQLDIVKHVIESKKADQIAADTRAKKIELRRRLNEALAKKEDEKLGGMSIEDIQKELAALDD